MRWASGKTRHQAIPLMGIVYSHTLSLLRSVCRDAYSAYIFSFDGYWQAATRKREFWSGIKPYV